MSAQDDLEHCRDAIRTGSRSFYAASHLLPEKVREPALALYAFCRLADDAVDLNTEKAEAVLSLSERLDLAYRDTPRDAPADRAFAAMIHAHDMPRQLPEALLEGLAWDAMGRTYDTLSDVRAYSARVASAVGAMMAVLMGVRDPDALARACDLGVAMQLTNICRDVGEDALEGRLYLPRQMMVDEGLEPESFLADPKHSAPLARVVRRLLAEAHRLYVRSEPGIPELPLSCRPGIYAARYIYDGIGREVRRNDFDSFSQRARTNGVQKLGWLGLSIMRSGLTVVTPRSPVVFARPLPEVAFLVDAAAHRLPQSRSRAQAVLDVFAQLEAERRLSH